MRWQSPLLLAVLLVAILAACDRQNLHRYQSFAFGTLIEIKIRNSDSSLADLASAGLFRDFDSMHRDWHAWEPGKLTQTSALLAKTEWFTADNSVLDLIKLAKQYSLLSNGLFNPVIGKLIQAWGFQGTGQPEIPPGQEEIDKLLADLPTANDIEIDGNRMLGHNAQIKLDLGAIAKGYAVAAGIQKLRGQGIQHALINAGGDLCGIGNQGKRRWRIGIRNPSAEGIMASIELDNDECVFTSGDYERYFTHDGKRYHHIIDPRSGYPADEAVSVTVLHRNGAIADAASTALFIAGPKGWKEIAAKMGVKTIMMVDRQGRIIMTPLMQKRIKLEVSNPERIVIISKPMAAAPSSVESSAPDRRGHE
jgi:thiamine biosynthesis lipoprotein